MHVYQYFFSITSFCQLNKTRSTCFDWADFFYLGVQHGWYDIMDHHGLSCDVLWKCFHLFEQTVQSSPYTQTLAAPINDCIWFPDFSDHTVRRADGTVWEWADSFVGERALTLFVGCLTENKDIQICLWLHSGSSEQAAKY